jgi:hypothetical protein
MGHEVLDILADVGQDATGATITPLPGGVSCETAVVTLPSHTVVVKRALGKLKVDTEWTSAPERITAEAAGLEWFHALTPDSVPAPIGVSPNHFGLVLPHAPSPCPDLRALLLEDPTSAPEGVGTMLATIATTWHAASPEGARGGELDDRVRVTELRLDPFYRDMAKRWPEYATVIRDLVDELETADVCVVHGDFTPKNVLCLPGGGVWVIDTEVAHIGHPVLDTASMLAHLTIKTLHHRTLATWDVVNSIRQDFLTTIAQHSPSVPSSLSRHLGLLMGVRVAGVARVPYLTPDTQRAIEHAARALLDGAHLDYLELS